MNKKGDFLDFFGDFVTIFVVAIILIALFFITSFNIDKKNITKTLQIENNLHPMTLLNLMKTPYDLDIKNDDFNLNTNLADLLVDSYKNDDFSKAKEAIKTNLNPLFSDNQCVWSLNVYNKNNDLIFSVGDFDINPSLIDNPKIRMSNLTLPINSTDSLNVFYGDNLLDKEYGKC